MADLPQKLTSIFETLQRTGLVNSRRVAPDTLAEFATILNQALPSCSAEAAQAALINGMATHDGKAFKTYTSRGSLRCLALWGGASNIARVFRITDLVVVKWNHSDQQYIVTPKHPRIGRSPPSIASSQVEIDKALVNNHPTVDAVINMMDGESVDQKNDDRVPTNTPETTVYESPLMILRHDPELKWGDIAEM